MSSDKKVTACKRCMFWFEIDKKIGECRQSAPGMIEIASNDDEVVGVAAWPQTENNDWCGDGHSIWLDGRYIHGPVRTP